MDRLIKKWNTAKNIVSRPQVYQEKNHSEIGILFFGTSQYAAEEAMDMLKDDGIVVDAIRIRAFPFNKTVEDFVNSHDSIFVIEQNRRTRDVVTPYIMRHLLVIPAQLARISI